MISEKIYVFAMDIGGTDILGGVNYTESRNTCIMTVYSDLSYDSEKEIGH